MSDDATYCPRCGDPWQTCECDETCDHDQILDVMHAHGQSIEWCSVCGAYRLVKSDEKPNEWQAPSGKAGGGA